MTSDVDHTAISIQVDPIHRRMRGTAVHGDTPFDVPYISQITADLWTGGCTNGLVLPSEISHVVSLYPWEQYTLSRHLESMMTVRLYDSVDAVDERTVFGVAFWINVCRKTGTTLVHCQAGLNRSALVAGLALVIEGMGPDDAIALLREKRSPAVLCNPVFNEWLRSVA